MTDKTTKAKPEAPLASKIVYTEELAKGILDRIAAGETAASVAASMGFSRRVISFWVAYRPDFAKRYREAVEEGCDAIADQVLAIADTPLMMDYEIKKNADGEVVGTIQREALAHRQLQIDTRLRMLRYMSPRYADKGALEITGKDGAPIELDTVTASEKIKAILAAAKKRMSEQEAAAKAQKVEPDAAQAPAGG